MPDCAEVESRVRGLKDLEARKREDMLNGGVLSRLLLFRCCY